MIQLLFFCYYMVHIIYRCKRGYYKGMILLLNVYKTHKQGQQINKQERGIKALQVSQSQQFEEIFNVVTVLSML